MVIFIRAVRPAEKKQQVPPLRSGNVPKGNLPICEDIIYMYRSAALHTIRDEQIATITDRRPLFLLACGATRQHANANALSSADKTSRRKMRFTQGSRSISIGHVFLSYIHST